MSDRVASKLNRDLVELTVGQRLTHEWRIRAARLCSGVKPPTVYHRVLIVLWLCEHQHGVGATTTYVGEQAAMSPHAVGKIFKRMSEEGVIALNKTEPFNPIAMLTDIGRDMAEA